MREKQSNTQPKPSHRLQANLIRPSTRTFFQQARQLDGFSLFNRMHGYVYARWIYLYIALGTGHHPVARAVAPLIRFWQRLFPARPGPDNIPSGTLADTYHGKVVPLEAATQLVTIDEAVTLTDLESVIPYPTARDIILDHPDHIVVLDCPCRSARPDPCLPLDVCLVVGEPFASFVAEHHPQRSRWITPQEAVDILRAEDERGHVHHAFFKDAMLDRFYAICNCCSCCCGAMQAQRNGIPMLATSGYVAQIYSDLCAGCGQCSDVCQFAAISVDEGVAHIDATACMGCGVCVAQCPQEAISLLRDQAKGEPLEIQKLIAYAAQATQEIADR